MSKSHCPWCNDTNSYCPDGDETKRLCWGCGKGFRVGPLPVPPGVAELHAEIERLKKEAEALRTTTPSPHGKPRAGN